MADIIWNYTGASRDLITYKDSEKLTTKRKEVDISLAVKELDHEISISLEDGIKSTVDWMKEYYRINK